MTIKFVELVGAAPRSGPRYRIIADAIAEGIVSGALEGGERLPPMRELAWALSVTTGTVARAYALAASRGHVGGEIGRGTYILASAAALPGTAAMPTQDATHVPMKANLPAEIGQTKTLGLELAALAREIGPPAFGYLATGGNPAHREGGARWCATGGFAPPADGILVCSGAQQAMLTAILTATEPGDIILTESLTYHAIATQAAMLGRRVAPVDMDEEGLVPDALAAACDEMRPRALFTMPTLHNPTTAVMGAARRAEIAGIAAARGLAVIEDDIYANLMDERPLPLAALLPDQTYYVNGLSKALAPGLRIAYLKPPRERLDRARAMLHGFGQTVPPVMADLATRILANGAAARLVALQKSEIAARSDIAAKHLAPVRCPVAKLRHHPAALHAWLQLPDAWRAGAFAEAARMRGVSIGAGEEFMVGQPDRAARHVRLCLGAPASRVDLERGLGIVAELLGEAPMEIAALA